MVTYTLKWYQSISAFNEEMNDRRAHPGDYDMGWTIKDIQYRESPTHVVAPMVLWQKEKR